MQVVALLSESRLVSSVRWQSQDGCSQRRMKGSASSVVANTRLATLTVSMGVRSVVAAWLVRRRLASPMLRLWIAHVLALPARC
jgi:hypothetical protein